MHAKANTAVNESGLQLNFIAVAPVVLGMADRLDKIVDLLGGELANALERGAQVLLFGGKLSGAR